MTTAEHSEEELSDDFDAEDSDVEQEEGEEEEPAASADEPPKKKMKVEDGRPKKAPTAEEMAHLKETQNLFHSNLFRMQISELLAEVTVKDKKDLEIRAFFEKLSVELKAICTGQQYKITDTDWLKPVHVPFSTVTEISGNFKFLPPKEVNLVGSFALGTCVKKNLKVDVAVQMPKEMFTKRDASNHVYSMKRALYLSTIAKEMINSELVSDAKFTLHHGNPFIPVLVLKPAELKGFQVYIHTSIEENTFSPDQFDVGKNNLVKNRAKADSVTYNSSVLNDLELMNHHRSLHRVVAGLSGVRQGIILLKIWLHQREIDFGYGGMNGFLVSMYVLSLLNHRKLNAQMSSYQIFRNTLLHLSTTNWLDAPPTVAEIDPSYVSSLTSSFPVVFAASSGLMNLCFQMSTALYTRMLHEAQKAMAFIDTPGVNGFDKLFLKPLPFMHTFDITFRLIDPQNLKSTITALNLEPALIDHNQNVTLTVIPSVIQLLHRALGDRVKLIAIQQNKPSSWEVTNSASSSTNENSVLFGFLLHPSQAFSTVDKGPSADTPEAEDFKAFWGEKSELRRFRDGTITEAVVWPCKFISEQRNVVTRICSYILETKAKIDSKQVLHVNECLDAVLSLPGQERNEEEQHSSIITAFDDLAKQIRMIKEFPLSILSIQGIDPVFRACEVFPSFHTSFIQTAFKGEDKDCMIPANKFAPFYCPAFRVVCVLEGSGKWPEDLEAVRRLKAACYVQLKKSLHGTNKYVAKCTPDYVDVYASGHVFRVSFGYIHEISLAKRQTSTDGFMQMKDTDYSQELEKELVILPRHTSTLNGVSLQYPSFALCVRLCKRWMAAQLMLGHDMLREEALELVCAHIYLHPTPYEVPRTALVGFLRFLHLMSTHDWANSPLLINLNEEFTKDDYVEIDNHFNENRSELPVMFISTPIDKTTSYWTTDTSAPILSRISLLAQESLITLEEQLLTEQDSNRFKLIFRPPVDIYDAVIHLKESYMPQFFKGVDVAKKVPEMKKSNRLSMPVVDYDPPKMFLQELKDTFSDIALFFFDCFGGRKIYVLWKPDSKTPKSFKVSNMVFSRPEVIESDDQPSLSLNTSAIIQDFKVMGQGLVESVTVKK